MRGKGSSTDPFLHLREQLCFALYNASRALTRAYGPLLEPLGITYPQYLVMLLLWETDAQSVKSLGEQLALDSGTLTPLLKRMEQQGLVRRTRSATDERSVEVTLTAEGKQLKTKVRRVPLAIASKAGFDLAQPDDVARLLSLRAELQELVSRLNDAVPEDNS